MKFDNIMSGSPAAETVETNLALSWAPGVVFTLLLLLVAIYAICVTPPPDVAQLASSGAFP